MAIKAGDDDPLFEDVYRVLRAPELVEEALKIGLIDERQAHKYLRNYYFFKHEEPIIEGLHDGKWVASINDKILVADSESHSMHSSRRSPTGNGPTFDLWE